MVNDDVVKCPLCGGFTHIENPALLQALHQPHIREQIENYVVQLLQTPGEAPASVAGGSAGP